MTQPLSSKRELVLQLDRLGSVLQTVPQTHELGVLLVVAAAEISTLMEELESLYVTSGTEGRVRPNPEVKEARDALLRAARGWATRPVNHRSQADYWLRDPEGNYDAPKGTVGQTFKLAAELLRFAEQFGKLVP